MSLHVVKGVRPKNGEEEGKLSRRSYFHINVDSGDKGSIILWLLKIPSKVLVGLT